MFSKKTCRLAMRSPVCSGFAQKSLKPVILSVVELLGERAIIQRARAKAKIVKTIFGIYYDLYCPFGIKVTFCVVLGLNITFLQIPHCAGKLLVRLFSPNTVEKRFDSTRVCCFVPLSFTISPCSAQDDTFKQGAAVTDTTLDRRGRRSLQIFRKIFRFANRPNKDLYVALHNKIKSNPWQPAVHGLLHHFVLN